MLTLERSQLDLDAETLRLEPGTTKNDDGRLVYLTPELKTLLSAQTDRVKALERRLGRIIPWLFPHLPAVHISPRLVGPRRKAFRKAWTTACKPAGVPGAIRHDFRRTAVGTWAIANTYAHAGPRPSATDIDPIRWATGTKTGTEPVAPLQPTRSSNPGSKRGPILARINLSLSDGG